MSFKKDSTDDDDIPSLILTTASSSQVSSNQSHPSLLPPTTLDPSQVRVAISPNSETSILSYGNLAYQPNPQPHHIDISRSPPVTIGTSSSPNGTPACSLKRNSKIGLMDSLLGSPRRATNLLAENTVNVRDAAKWIGRAIVKLGQPDTVMIVAKAQEPGVVLFTREVAKYLIVTPRPCSATGLTVFVESRFESLPLFNYSKLVADNPIFKDRLKFWSPQFCANHADTIDFIITIGGDGTVLYTAWLFQHTPVPPVIPFHLGSLGFLTLFNITNIKDVLERFIGCSADGIRVNMRMRLSCTIWRHRHHLTSKGSGPANHHVTSPKLAGFSGDPIISGSDFYPLSHSSTDPNGSPTHTTSRLLNPLMAAVASEPDLSRFHDSPRPRAYTRHALGVETNSRVKAVPIETFHILNDLVVDRGPSAFLSQLELFVDNRHLTNVQADGLVISTPTGSTAYSLSAGGSLVHPEVPSFLITPICPHTLSFRPMMLPDSVELKIQVPFDSRASAWASFDGRHRVELFKGDYITVTMSRLPMATVCMDDQSADWFESLRRCLHWNERARQKAFSSHFGGNNPLERQGPLGVVNGEEFGLEELAERIMNM